MRACGDCDSPSTFYARPTGGWEPSPGSWQCLRESSSSSASPCGRRLPRHRRQVVEVEGRLAPHIRISTIAPASKQTNKATIDPNSTVGVVAIALNPTAHHPATTQSQTASGRRGGRLSRNEGLRSGPGVRLGRRRREYQAHRRPVARRSSPANCSLASWLIAP